MTASPVEFGFRADIQGLRALAVVLVFFSHAGWPPFAGGFIGVDVFFVISGYVITCYLMREYAERGEISLWHFYARRLQRLLPALLVMVLLVASLATLLLPRQERLIHLDAAANALLWISNLFFYFTRLGYFESAANENLFLHTWTLGVEEQFYLVWPLLLSVGLMAARRRVLPVLLTAVMFFTLGLCLFWAYRDPNAAFYMMPSRGWQFAAGGLVAWWHQSGGSLASPRLANFASATGAALVLGTAALLDENTAYPRLNALAPTLGAALVLAGSGWCNRLLSLRPVTWLGDVSYGFYLWHWPVLLFFSDLRPFYPALSTALAFVLTGVLAAASYYLLEQPVRTNRRLLSRPRLVIAGALVLMLSAILLVRQGMANFIGDWGDEVIEIQRAASVMPQYYEDGCDDWYESADLRLCVYGNPSSERTVVMLGDSIGLQWFAAVESIFRERGWRVLVLSKSSCPIADLPFYYPKIRADYTVCEQWRNRAVAYIGTLEPDLLIIGSAGNYPFTADQWRLGTGILLEQLAPRAQRIALMAPTPTLDTNGPWCLARRARLAQLLPKSPVDGCSNPVRVRPQLSGLQAAAESYENVYWVDLSELVCPDSTCRARQGQYLAYRDGSHLTEQFVMSLRDVLESRLAPPQTQ